MTVRISCAVCQPSSRVNPTMTASQNARNPAPTRQKKLQ